MSEDKPARTGVLARGIAVLRAFGEENEAGLSLTEVSQRAGLDKSTTLRLLRVLLNERFVHLDERSKLYRLDVGILALVATAVSQLDIRVLARPAMDDLVRTVKETVALNVRTGWHRTCIEQVETIRELRMSSRIGYPYPLHAGAPGKALLAFLDLDEIEQVLDRAVTEIEDRRVDEGKLRADLAGVRGSGIAFSQEETTTGASAVAVPIRDAGSRVVAALSIAAPLDRFEPRNDVVIAALRRAADEIEARLGFQRAVSPPQSGDR